MPCPALGSGERLGFALVQKVPVVEKELMCEKT